MSRKAAIITGNISESRGTIHAYVVFHEEPAALAALASNMHLVGYPCPLQTCWCLRSAASVLICVCRKAACGQCSWLRLLMGQDYVTVNVMNPWGLCSYRLIGNSALYTVYNVMLQTQSLHQGASVKPVQHLLCRLEACTYAWTEQVRAHMGVQVVASCMSATGQSLSATCPLMWRWGFHHHAHCTGFVLLPERKPLWSFGDGRGKRVQGEGDAGESVSAALISAPPVVCRAVSVLCANIQQGAKIQMHLRCIVVWFMLYSHAVQLSHDTAKKPRVQKAWTPSHRTLYDLFCQVYAPTSFRMRSSSSSSTTTAPSWASKTL